MVEIEHINFYADLGWRLFPCKASDKSPLTVNGFYDATSDVGQLTEWFRQNPGCVWGTPTSEDAGVFEYDKRHDPYGKLWKQHVEGKPMPKTWQSVSGGGSPHFWFRWPKGTRSSERYGHAFGLKAHGGYVLIPPSRCSIDYHTGPYKWIVRPWETPIADAPDWLVELFNKPDVKNLKPDSDHDPWVVREANPDLLTHPGCDKEKGEQRRPTLCKLIGVHLARGDNPATIEALVRGWASRCNPPLEEHEWRPHFERLCAKEAAKRPTMEHCFDDLPGVDIPVEVEDTFLPGRVADTEQDGGDGVLVSSDGLPRLSQAAYYGLLGEMLRAVETETEADPAAVLLGWLTAFGNVVGRGAWTQVGATRHCPALYVGIVGRTSAAKGDAWKVSRYSFEQVEAEWSKACICPGVGSGEGLLERIADEQKISNLNRKTGMVEEEIIPGAADKRCLLRLSEFSRLFKSQRRENNPLSEILREAWDLDPISVPNRKGNSLSTSGYTVSVLGDVTPDAIRKIMETGTEAFDGFANRFLWAAVQSGRDLDDGGNIGVLHPFIGRLNDALAFAKTAGALKRDDEAAALWKSVYGDLKRSGDTVPHTDRARPQVVRLSILFALTDKSNVICLPHLEAALAVWDYCRESARLIFGGDNPSPDNPDPLWLEVISFITANPSVSQTDITVKFKHKAKADQLSEVLAGLQEKRLAFPQERDTGGRKAKCWYPVEPDDTNDNLDTAEGAEGKKASSGDDGGEDTFFPTPVANRQVESGLCVSTDFPTAERGLPSAPATVHVGGIMGAGEHERGLLRP